MAEKNKVGNAVFLLKRSIFPDTSSGDLPVLLRAHFRAARKFVKQIKK